MYKFTDITAERVLHPNMKNVRIMDIKGPTTANNGVSFEWNSYEDWKADREVMFANRPGFQSRVSHDDGTSLWGGSESWWGTNEGYKGVLRRLEDGWPELLEQLMKKIEDVELDLPQFPSMSNVRRRKRRHDEFGDEVDMTRVWSGQLDTAWTRPVRTQRMASNTKRINVAFDVTANGNVNNKMAMWRAALAVLLCDSLARCGRIFEIWVIDSTTRPFQSSWGVASSAYPQRLWSSWCVKRTSDPLVLERLCGMVSVGFMRSAGFSAMGASKWPPSGGFGGALGDGFPAVLLERVQAGEQVMRIGQCYTRDAMLAEYRRAWEELERNIAAAQERQA